MLSLLQLEILQFRGELPLQFSKGADLYLKLLLQFDSSSFTDFQLSFELAYPFMLLQADLLACKLSIFKVNPLIFQSSLRLDQLVFNSSCLHLQVLLISFQLLDFTKHFPLLLDIILNSVFYASFSVFIL
jgi:hypothetical protein